MKKTFRLLSLALMATLIATAFTACSDDEDSEKKALEEDYTPPVSEDNFVASDEQIPALTYCFSGVRNDLDGALKMRFKNFADEIVPEVKAVIVPASKLTGESGQQVAKAYTDGKLIIVTEPTDAILSQWCEENELDEISLGESNIDVDNEDSNPAVKAEALLITFNNNGTRSVFHDPTEGEPMDASELNKYLNGFTTWVNEVLLPVIGDMNSGDLAMFNCQSEHITFQVHLDKEVGRLPSSSPDKLLADGTIDCYLDITPLYAFQDQQNPGDYYIVHSKFVPHNRQTYKGWDGIYHGGTWSTWAGYMMSQFEVMTQIKDQGDVTFPTEGTPTPTTTTYNTTHTEGTTISLNGSVTGGVSEKSGASLSATLSGGVSWSKSTSVTYPDIMIKSASDNAKPHWYYTINPDGLGHFNNHISKEWKKPQADVAINDMTVEQWWVWRVPSTKDGEAKTFKAKIEIWPTYKTKWYWGFGSDDRDHKMNYEYEFELKAPNRTPTGQLVLKNSFSKGFIDDIRLYRDGKLIYTFDSEIDPAEALTKWVETGKYDIQFTQKVRQDGKFVETTYASTRKIEITRGDTRTIHTDNYFEEGKVQ